MCPLLERGGPGARDVVTPYGFSGFAARGVGLDLLAAWRRQAQAQGWVCGYLGLHPLLDTRDYPADEVSSASCVYALNLESAEADLAAGFSHNLRAARLAQWEKSGAQLTDEASACRRFFRAHYPEFMRRVKASAAYDFSGETLDALLAHSRRVHRRRRGGARPRSRSLSSATRGTAANTSSMFRLSRPSSFGATVVGRHEGTQAARRPHLESRRRDPARQTVWMNSRARFGGARRPLRALKQVYDALSYRRGCENVGVDAHTRIGYFPAYRSPQVSQSAASKARM